MLFSWCTCNVLRLVTCSDVTFHIYPYGILRYSVHIQRGDALRVVLAWPVLYNFLVMCYFKFVYAVFCDIYRYCFQLIDDMLLLQVLAWSVLYSLVVHTLLFDILQSVILALVYIDRIYAYSLRLKALFSAFCLLSQSVQLSMCVIFRLFWHMLNGDKTRRFF